MPRFTKKQSPYRKKRVTTVKGGRVIRKRSYATNNNLKSLNPIAQRYICKMKYAQTVSSDGFGRYAFNLNSIYDPDRTGGGHQPYGHDTFETMYNRYRVISCSYRILAPKNDATLQLAVQPANEVLAPTTAAEMKENPRSRYITQSPGGQVVPLSGKVYIPSLVGRTKSQYMSDDRYQAQFGVNPAELAILNLIATSGADVAVVGNPLHVELVYTVEVFDIKHLAQS